MERLLVAASVLVALERVAEEERVPTTLRFVSLLPRLTCPLAEALRRVVCPPFTYEERRVAVVPPYAETRSPRETPNERLLV